MMKTGILSILLILIISVSLTHASPSDTGMNESSPSIQNGSIGIIPSGSTSPFHRELTEAATRTALEKGWKALILTPDIEENITAQKTAMKVCIQDKVNAIALNSLNPAILSEEVAAADKAGIPVLLYNTLTPVKGIPVTGYIGYNQYAGAAKLGSYAGRLLAEKHNDTLETVQGKVFILRGLPGFHAEQRTAGFKAGLAASPGIIIAGEETAGWDRETAKKIATKALLNDKGIDIFYANSDEMAIGAAQAAQEQGKKINSDIFILGVDGNVPTLEMIRNGTVTATLGVYPEKMGETVIYQIEKIRAGDDIGMYLETPSLVVDAINLDAYLNQSTWTDPIESEPEKIIS